MKKTALIFGSIIGLLFCINLFYMVSKMQSGSDFEGNDVVGYAAMVIVFSLIYFGIRNYRNKQLDGTISFGSAFKTGLFIALVGSTIYVVVWLFYYYLFVPDFIDHYTAYVLEHADPAEVDAKAQEMAEFKESYKNPLFVILITYFEVFPVGLVVALLSALILKKKNP